MVFCSYYLCNNSTLRNKHVSYFTFPKNKEYRDIWLENINARRAPTKSSKVCSDHFHENEIFTRTNNQKVLKPNAFPYHFQHEIFGTKLPKMNMPMVVSDDPLLISSPDHLQKSCFKTSNLKNKTYLSERDSTISTSSYEEQTESSNVKDQRTNNENRIWLATHNDDDMLEADCKEDEDDVMLLCRFCLLKKPRMERLEWSKWPTASISKLFQKVVGEALIVSDKISEFWCSECHCEMQKMLTDILRWKKANQFWRSHWYKQVQIDADLKMEMLEDDREAKDEPIEMLELEEFVYEIPLKSHVNEDSDDGMGDAVIRSIGAAEDEETTYNDDENELTIEDVDIENVDLDKSCTSADNSKEMNSPQVPPVKQRKRKYIKKNKQPKVEIVTEEVLNCPLCSKTFNSRPLYKKHRKEDHSDPASLICDLCARQCTTKIALFKHRKAVHGSKHYVHKCDEPGCSKSFRYGYQLRYHKTRHGEKTLICDKCHVALRLKKDMIEHWHNVHLRLNSTICEHCGRTFVNRYLMRKTHTPEQCKQSNSLNRTYTNTTRRYRPAVSRSPLQCRACTHVCHMPETLERHYGEVHPEWNVADEMGKICMTCYGQFETADEREDHQKSVHDLWQCQICKMSLKCQQSLDRHMLRHPMDKERRYRCEVCGSQHLSLTHMKGHYRRAHTNIRPYECDICHRRFADVSEMRTHRKSHTQERVPCPECGKLYHNAKAARDHHRKEHTNEFVFFSCKFCDDKFRNSQTMEAHARVHHPKEFQLGGFIDYFRH